MANVKGKSMCVFSARGGVGKSTTVLNMAGVFSCLKQKVLIIDMDVTGGAIATLLNKTFDKSIYSFMDDYINNRFNNIKDYATKYNDNIDFIAASKDPRQGTKISSSYISILIEKASFEYDTILIDMNHKIDEFNINIIDECDLTLLVITNDLIDIKNTRNLINIFKDGKKANYQVLLNECVSLNKNYYSLYDIKNIIGANIDYKITKEFYIKSYDKYVSDGNILTLYSKITKEYPKTYKTYMSIANTLMEGEYEK